MPTKLPAPSATSWRGGSPWTAESLVWAPTSGPSSEPPGKAINLGSASHIAAAAPRGPRYNAKQSAANRKSIDNAIWLCQFCVR